MSNTYFANNRPNTRRSFNNSNQYVRPSTRNSLNFTDNFNDFTSNFHNSSIRSTRAQQNKSTSHLLNSSYDLNSSIHSFTTERSFSSLFCDNSSSKNKLSSADEHSSSGESCFSRQNFAQFHDLSSDEDDGVYLQISNLDSHQWYDESSLKHYLMNQLKPITPILSLTIETPSIAKVKVPSIQFAKQVVSHLHRKKMGHKRIFVSFLKDKTSAECSALRNKVIGLLMDVPMHQLPMSKFRELFQSRFKSSISILDLYRMPDVCSIAVNSNDEKIISLETNAARANEAADVSFKADQHSAPYCMYHYKQDKNKGWAEIEIEPLPNVSMTIVQVQSMIQPLLQIHQGDIPVASLLYCLEAELNIQVQPNERGVSFEHLVACVPNVKIRYNDYGIKILAWSDENLFEETGSSKNSTKTNLNSSCGDSADNISKEVIELIRMCPKSTMQFSKFIPTYHNHFGKQCRVADYGCTKLIEMFEAMSSVVQVLGEGESRQITLTHRVQIRRFSTDIYKIIRNHPSKSILLSNLPQLYFATYNRSFDPTDYGVCDVQDLIAGLRNSNFILVSKFREDSNDFLLSLQKRRQTTTEVEKTSIFAGEVVELLHNAPQFSIPFRKFVRSYHYYFGYQCKLSDYGFMRLAELLEALSGIVEMDLTNEENRKIFLSRKVALRIFSEQIQEIIKSMTGKNGTMVKFDELMEAHKSQFGYQMHGSSLGYESVIDALKFVPFVELHSYENEVWLVSHLESQKFRQRAMLACLTITDLRSDTNSMVPLSKFHVAFCDKFKFSISEKQLHAMKHAVQIEMVNGIKMISVTPMMKFIMHVVGVLDQRKRMNIQEIKSVMKISLATCFNFGYPNLSLLMQAFPDVFNVSKLDMNFMGRSDVEVARECPFTASGLQKLLAMNQVQLPDDKPEIHKQVQKHPIGFNRIKHKPPVPSIKPDIQPHPFVQLNPYCRNYNSQNNANIQVHSYLDGDVTMPTELLGNFPHSCQKYEEPQGFYERNLKFQQQQQQVQAMKRDYWNNSAGCSSTGSSYDSAQQKFNGLSAYAFETPESPKLTKPTTIWFDPVWKDDAGLFESNRVGGSAGGGIGASGSNITDSLKAFNVHVVSPFMSFKTMFTFDNASSSGSNSNNNNGNNQNML